MSKSSDYGDISDFSTHEISSAIFTQKEINHAINTAKNYFYYEFEGCTLIELYYADDEE